MGSYSFGAFPNSAPDAELERSICLIANRFKPRLARAKLSSDSLITSDSVSDSQLDTFSGNNIRRERQKEMHESLTNLNIDDVVVHW
jgi:hypothetical protein